jgi:nucleoside-diphosphate-sugar epimerase
LIKGEDENKVFLISLILKINRTGQVIALVTGATGFIGSHIADELYKMGYQVRCTVRKSSNLRWLKDKPYELVDASLNDESSLIKAVEGVDYVFHSAGLTAARDMNEFLEGNRNGTVNLLNAIKKAAPGIKRFVYVSSQTAAGPSKSYEKPVDEMCESKPITSYGKSKKAAEDEVLKFRSELPVTIVRPSAVYGPRDVEIYKIFKTVKMGLGTLVGFNPKYINLIHSDDLVRGIIQSALSEKSVGNTYFLASEEMYTWPQLIGIIQEALGKKFVVKLRLPHFLVLQVAGISGFFGKFSKKPPVFNYEKGIDFIQDYWTCSVERAKKDFGFRQMVPVKEGIENTIKWYRENKWL